MRAAGLAPLRDPVKAGGTHAPCTCACTCTCTCTYAHMHTCTHAHVHTCSTRTACPPPMLHARRRGTVALGPRALRRTAARAAPLLPCRLVHVRCCSRPAPRTAATLCIPAATLCVTAAAASIQAAALCILAAALCDQAAALSFQAVTLPRIPGACCPRCSRLRTWPSARPRPTGRLRLGLG